MMTRRRQTRTRELRNLRMSPEVYKLRREVMSLIYEAKGLRTFPRVEVRITENGRGEHSNTLGLAAMGDRVIWVPERALSGSYNLRHIVFHELLHAVWGVEHDESSPLMAPTLKDATKETIHKEFLRLSRDL